MLDYSRRCKNILCYCWNSERMKHKWLWKHGQDSIAGKPRDISNKRPKQVMFRSSCIKTQVSSPKSMKLWALCAIGKDDKYKKQPISVESSLKCVIHRKNFFGDILHKILWQRKSDESNVLCFLLKNLEPLTMRSDFGSSQVQGQINVLASFLVHSMFRV